MGDVRQHPSCHNAVGDLRLKAAAMQSSRDLYRLLILFYIQIVCRLSFGCRSCPLFVLQSR
jgi:hypothetical protein